MGRLLAEMEHEDCCRPSDTLCLDHTCGENTCGENAWIEQLTRLDTGEKNLNDGTEEDESISD